MNYDTWKSTEPDYCATGRDWTCDECGLRQNELDPPPIHLEGVGNFCSPACADEASERHAARMDPRR